MDDDAAQDLLQLKMHVGEAFQQLTKYPRGTLPITPLGETRDYGPFKNYPDAEIIPLAEPNIAGGAPIWSVIGARRSHRQFTADSMTVEELGQILWAGQGITFATQGFGFRAAPSAGALYPTETYIVVNRVESLAPGLYHYNIKYHSLEFILDGDFGEKLAQAALGQDMVERAAANIIWTAIISRSAWKYDQRAYRYVYLDTAHVAQNVMLAATALDLGTCGIGAFYDDRVNDFLGVDGANETVVYMCVVGKLKKAEKLRV
jgi:SagB-type dehydrogenase family enzyme